MNLFVTLAAAAPEAATGNPVADIAHQFGVTWQLLISQIVLFVIVAVALKKFAYGPILKVLEERRQRIAEGIANAEKIKADLANAQAKAQEIIAQASAQANKMIEEGRAAAAKVQEAETQKAIAEAQRLIAKAQESNAAEMAKLRADVMKDMTRLVGDMTARVTGRILTLDDQKRLQEETTKQIAA